MTIAKATALGVLLVLALQPRGQAGQEPVEIRVDSTVRQGTLKPIWTYFGYDEPNYTYANNGRKLVGELSALSQRPVYIRVHHLLCTGDGTPAMKWGSTNAYTEDASGKPVYDWRIIDRIFGTYVQAGAKPFVEIGFMPEALSVKPEPYVRHWPKPDDGVGWSYPPKDYGEWSELISEWVRHSIARYGKGEVESWYWEVWNEPDISYWRGTPEEYDKLYDYAAEGVKRVLPTARVGGPASTGPGNPKAAAFLQQFLEHCARGTNYATGKVGAPLDFISYHAKGAPEIVEGHVRMGLSRNLNDVAKGLEIVTAIPQFKKLPVILSECDPEGCAACSARLYPHNAYRNGTLYPTYTAAALINILKLADRYHANLEGMLTWAFEFEGQPYFDGLRTLATNGIDKPVLNLFRMVGMMQGDRVQVNSTGAVSLDQILQRGVRDAPDVDALASRSDREIDVLVWNYHDDDSPAPEATVKLTVNGVPDGVPRLLLRHYRIDQDHSNAYTLWQRMGAPQNPTPQQYAQLEAAGQLELLDSPRWAWNKNGSVDLRFDLPRQAVSLVQLSW
ncbi:MAG TPA: beta-xylosidase [Terriglobia bacterium]|nr:beta-xylosidase [Terriglobia bacterium]